MKIFLSLSILNFFLLSSSVRSCDGDAVAKGTPKCIIEKISDIASEEVWNPPATIYSYQYKGQAVYHFPAKCCDIPSTVFDENCNAICSPDGGFTGKGDGKCADFFDERTDEKLIWKDERGS